MNVPSENKKLVRLAVSFALVAAGAFALGFWSGGGNSSLAELPGIGSVFGTALNSTPDDSLSLTQFWEAYHVLQDKFVQTHASSTPTDGKKMLWGAIAGLTASYGDPYTVFFPPAEAKTFQENIAGNFGGVGMEIGANKDGILTVIAPLKDSPAERAGVRAGDLIAYVNGTSTDSMSTDEAVSLIRGPKGTSVKLTLVREGKPLELSIVRDTINVPTIDEKYDPNTGIYTIALYSFTANSGELFDTALQHFRSSGGTKLLIDLRGNPGGYLDAAVSMASHFLPKDAVVVTEDYRGKRDNLVHKSFGVGGVPEGTKVVILIDPGSASASEILAGALQDNKIANLIGTRSFGKGSVQELVDVGGGSLKVTVARWLTPSGRSISDGGLHPDIEVTRTQEDFTAGKDPQKERAIIYLVSGK